MDQMPVTGQVVWVNAREGDFPPRQPRAYRVGSVTRSKSFLVSLCNADGVGVNRDESLICEREGVFESEGPALLAYAGAVDQWVSDMRDLCDLYAARAERAKKKAADLAESARTGDADAAAGTDV